MDRVRSGPSLADVQKVNNLTPDQWRRTPVKDRGKMRRAAILAAKTTK